MLSSSEPWVYRVFFNIVHNVRNAFRPPQIADGAVVGGVVYGHTVTFVDAKWSLQLAPSTVGECALIRRIRVQCQLCG